MTHLNVTVKLVIPKRAASVVDNFMSTSVAARVKVIPDLFAVNVGNDDLKVTAIASFFVSSDKFFT